MSSTGKGHDGREPVYYLGAIIFAVLAIVVVPVFLKKFRQSND
jgi:hypothetical protein